MQREHGKPPSLLVFEDRHVDGVGRMRLYVYIYYARNENTKTASRPAAPGTKPAHVPFHLSGPARPAGRLGGHPRPPVLPLAAAAHQMFLSASGLGHGRADDSQVLRAYRALSPIAKA